MLDLDLTAEFSLLDYIKSVVASSVMFGAVAAVLVLLVAVGQVLAIGFDNAWQMYRQAWLLTLLISMGVGAALNIGLIYCCYLLESKEKRHYGRLRFLTVLRLAAPVAALVVLSLFVASFAYINARSSNAIVSRKYDDRSAISLVRSANAQKRAFSKLSANTDELLNKINSTEHCLVDARLQLRGITSDIKQQMDTADSTIAKTQSLVGRQHQIELQTKEIERILHGRAPITKQDLEESGRQSLILGALLGFLGSFGASMLLSYMNKHKKAELR